MGAGGFDETGKDDHGSCRDRPPGRCPRCMWGLIEVTTSTAGTGAAVAKSRTSSAGDGKTSAAPRAESGAPEERAAREGSGSSSQPRGAEAFVRPGTDNSIPTYGSEASPPTRAEATTALETYLQARSKGDWATACAQLGAIPKRQLDAIAHAGGVRRSTCRSIYPKLTTPERADPLSGAIAALRVKGNRAFALFYGSNGHQYMIPMIREAGSWKVNQVAPLGYPIGAPTGGG